MQRHVKRIILLLKFSLPLFAALPSATVWEVRSAGNDNSGGGFVTGASGTDYSQQNSAQYSFTDLASADGTTSPCQVTSVSHSFVAADVGNLLHVTAGTNWTAGFYEIVSVLAGTATLDRACGSSAALTSGTWTEGGALATPNQAITNLVNGNHVYIAKGVYTRTTTITIPSVPSEGNFVVEGYSLSRGDAPTGSNRPTLTSATNSVNIITYSNIASGIWKYLIFSSTAGTPGDGFYQTNSSYSPYLYLIGCQITGTENGIRATSSIFWSPLYLENTEIASVANIGIYLNNSGNSTVIIVDSTIHNSGSDGINQTGNNLTLTMVHSVIYSNGGQGLNINTELYATIVNSVFYGNTSNGIDFTSSGNGIVLNANNTIFVNNGVYGINVNASTAPTILTLNYCAFYGNTTGKYTWATSANAGSFNEISITGSPFVSGTNFALNNSSGAGAALRGTGFPGTSPAGTGYLDVGALQHQGGGAVGYGIVQ